MGNASRSLPILRPPQTLLPFLYQSTRPCSALRRARVQTSNGLHQHSLDRGHCTFQNSALRRENIDIHSLEPCKSQTKQTHSSSRVSRRIRYTAPSEKQQPPSSRHDAGESTDDIPFESPSNSQDINGTRSTMTPAEKNTFERLFGSLLEKKPQAASESTEKSKIMRGDDHKGAQSLVLAADEEIRGQLEEEESNHNLSDIFSDQIGSEAASRLSQYPKTLRDMAIKTQSRLARSTQQRNDDIVVQAREEMLRVEQKLLAAQTDLDLWNALDQEVFDKIYSLSLDPKPFVPVDQSEARGNSAHQKQKPKASQQTAPKNHTPDASATAVIEPNASSASTAPTTKDQQRHLTIMTHTYAPLLLAALRLLTSRAPTSSLPGVLLARAKALGPTSYALAASTPLYNDLLAWTWRTTSSYTQVLSLLREMDAAGLTMDAHTLEAVDDICAFRAHVATDHGGGGAIAAVEATPGRAREADEVAAWGDRIRVGLEEMEMERLRMAEAREALEREERELEREHRLAEEASAVSPIRRIALR